MDYYSHIISGIAVASVASSQLKSKWQMPATFFAGAVGAIFPDVDTLTLHKDFDTTVGSLLRLHESGREIYSGVDWYSHHYFFHSIAGVTTVSVLAFLIAYFFSLLLARSSIKSFFSRYKIPCLTFFFGGIAHLIGDLPTPPGITGGIRLLWPNTEVFGGAGKIWWNHNFDLMLLFMLCVLINMVIVFGTQRLALMKTMIVFVLTIGAVWYQIEQRNFEFNPTKGAEFSECERRSMDFQKNILGERGFYLMMRFEEKTSLHGTVHRIIPWE